MSPGVTLLARIEQLALASPVGLCWERVQAWGGRCTSHLLCFLISNLGVAKIAWGSGVREWQWVYMAFWVLLPWRPDSTELQHAPLLPEGSWWEELYTQRTAAMQETGEWEKEEQEGEGKEEVFFGEWRAELKDVSTPGKGLSPLSIFHLWPLTRYCSLLLHGIDLVLNLCYLHDFNKTICVSWPWSLVLKIGLSLPEVDAAICTHLFFGGAQPDYISQTSLQ